MNNITDFHPLILPHLDGSRKGQWCTFSSNNDMVYLLNDNRYAVDGIGKMSDPVGEEIHFSSEDECHRQASEYYTRYGQAYPYMKEWSAVMWNVDVVSVTESQVMEFI